MIHFDRDEKIIKEIRGPKAGILIRVVIIAILSILPLIFLEAFNISNFYFLTVMGSSKALFLFSYSLWLLLVWMYFFVWWMRYCLHALILTDSRIFDISKRQMFNRSVISVRLEDIEEIKVNYKSMLKRLSQIGKLIVITKAADGSTQGMREIIFDNVFEPEAMRQLILNVQRARRDALATVRYGADEVEVMDF